MKQKVSGKNPDGSPHTVYTPEGMSIQLIDELWQLSDDKDIKYPLTLHLSEMFVPIGSRFVLIHFLRGLTVGFQMNQVF